jgi:3'-phosphoadenosine 5'-phosphosulfate sulfotransferase (PAPS reductase)/FAD synthetase
MGHTNRAAAKVSPYKVDGPAVISFSGGRTSAFLLRHMLDQGLGQDVHVLFANTGKERPETLEFVHQCETRWGVTVHWLEYRPGNEERKARYEEVDYEHASRDGEPFDMLVAHRDRLPNPLMRICTQELKIRVMREWMKDHDYRHWWMVVGLRADEPRRVARMEGLNEQAKERWTTVMPLSKAGVVEEDVLAFWKEQPFDLKLRTWEGNCDLCFLKSHAKKVRIVQDNPQVADWWLEKEASHEPFRRHAKPYAAIVAEARRLPLMHIEGAPDDDLGDCLCTD